MNAKPTLARPHVATTVAAATLAVLIGGGLFAGVVNLFQRDGVPFEQQLVAERACANHALVRWITCVSAHLAARNRHVVASR